MQRWAWVFPGQGVESLVLMERFWQQSAAARSVLTQVSDVTGVPPTAWWEGPPPPCATAVSQQLIVGASVAAAAALAEAEPSMQPQAVAGLSLGEYSALIVAGVLSVPEGLWLVQQRALALEAAFERHPGGMVAVLGLVASRVEEVVSSLGREDVVCANYTAADQVILSGSPSGLAAAVAACQEAGARRLLPLRVAGPAHSPFVADAAPALEQALHRVTWHPPRCTIQLNASPVQVSEAGWDWTRYLLQQITAPARWTQSVAGLLELAPDAFLEVGPGQVLSGLLRRHQRDIPVLWVDRPGGVEAAVAAWLATPSAVGKE